MPSKPDTTIYINGEPINPGVEPTTPSTPIALFANLLQRNYGESAIANMADFLIARIGEQQFGIPPQDMQTFLVQQRDRNTAEVKSKQARQLADAFAQELGFNPDSETKLSIHRSAKAGFLAGFNKRR